MAINATLQQEHEQVTEMLGKMDNSARHLLRRYGTQVFWETKVAENMVMGKHDHAIQRLLDLGVIECVPYSNDWGYGYKLTYFGTLCVQRLGIALPPVSFELEREPLPAIIINDDFYDQLEKEKPQPDDKPTSP